MADSFMGFTLDSREFRAQGPSSPHSPECRRWHQEIGIAQTRHVVVELLIADFARIDHVLPEALACRPDECAPRRSSVNHERPRLRTNRRESQFPEPSEQEPA